MDKNQKIHTEDVSGTCDKGYFEDCRGHVEDHAAEDEVDAPSASVDDLVQGPCLSGQVESQVQGMQVSEDLCRRIPDGTLCNLQKGLQKTF